MKVNKTFSIDYELIIELKKLRNRNGGLRNKSAFVNAAIWNRIHEIDNTDDQVKKMSVSDAPIRQLMAGLMARDDCPEMLQEMLLICLTLPKKNSSL